MARKDFYAQQNSSPDYTKFTSFGADIDLTRQTGLPQRMPRMVWWNSGVLNTERDDGTAVAMPSGLAGQQVSQSFAKILSASTTATEVMVWW